MRKSTSELFTWVVLLDPADAVLVDLFGFLGQHRILQVCSVETHGEAENVYQIENVQLLNSTILKQDSFKDLSQSQTWTTYTCGRVILSWLRMSF